MFPEAEPRFQKSPQSMASRPSCAANFVTGHFSQSEFAATGGSGLAKAPNAVERLNVALPPGKPSSGSETIDWTLHESARAKFKARLTVS